MIGATMERFFRGGGFADWADAERWESPVGRLCGWGGWPEMCLLAQAPRAKPLSLPPEILAQLALWFAVLVALVLGAVLLVRRLRDQSSDSGDAASGLVTILREMKQEGDISDAEFRKLNAVLRSKLRQHSRDEEKPA